MNQEYYFVTDGAPSTGYKKLTTVSSWIDSTTGKQIYSLDGYELDPNHSVQYMNQYNPEVPEGVWFTAYPIYYYRPIGSVTPTTPGTPNRGSDVPGSDVPGSNLPGSDVPGSNLPGSDVPGSNVPGSNLPGSELPGSELPGSDVPGSDVPGSNATGSNATGSNAASSDVQQNNASNTSDTANKEAQPTAVSASDTTPQAKTTEAKADNKQANDNSGLPSTGESTFLSTLLTISGVAILLSLIGVKSLRKN